MYLIIPYFPNSLYVIYYTRMVLPIETTQDFLYLALAVAILAVAFFLCWALYFLVMTLKDARVVTHDIRRRVESLWEVIELLREKLQIGGAVFKLAAHGIKELAEYVRVFTEENGTPKKKRAKKKEDKKAEE